MTVIYSDKPLEERMPNDFYETPVPLTVAALRNIPDPKNTMRGFVKTVHDLGAGTGNWGRGFREVFGFKPKMIGIDPHHPEVYGYDYWLTTEYETLNLLKQKTLPRSRVFPQLVMSNPPFRMAEQFVRTGFASLDDGGWMVFLLRLAFLESKGRCEGLWRELPPYKVSVLAERIPWGNHPKGKQGKSDDTAFSLYYWHKGSSPSITTADCVTPAGGTRLEWLSWKSPSNTTS